MWAFDPQRIIAEAPSWYWNPLASIDTLEDALELATMFVKERGQHTGNSAYFTGRSQAYLGYLILAASQPPETATASWQPTLVDVDRWLDTPTSPEPVARLVSSPQASHAQALASIVNERSTDAAQGVYTQTRKDTMCLKVDSVRPWVIPSGDRPAFDVTGFLTSTDTLYLLSESASDLSAAPLVAAFANAIFKAGRLQARTYPNGRLPIPLVSVLDEAANIVQIPNLPDLYSYFGSIGMPVMTILQSYDQARKVWGKDGAGQLWSSATVKLLGAGLDDLELTKTVATFIGRHEVDVTSASWSARTGQSRSISTQKEQLWSEADVRSIPKGTALMLASGLRPVHIAQTPWYEGPDHKSIKADAETAGHLIAQRSAEAA